MEALKIESSADFYNLINSEKVVLVDFYADWCGPCKLQSLDLSQNTNLTYLYCGRNPLTTLDLSKNAKLKVLNCSGFGNKYMELTELDLSQNTALESLDCSLNKLKELNVSGCTALVKLDCGDNNRIERIVLATMALQSDFCCH